eukprot:CAMPEP_0177643510 /NCGR_PEP_ID=MMETSP0447-20121125/8191_1 /TAXON_ID=0 /ORGANISM="Stygamoeba regulata, Strain BSH-02190019" /LENGTH=815 /DNA_ID=CAMNT_0019145805 /DNA_START=63 /DNA_END=2511 /DNA_ORIENTATION=+
MAADSSHVLFEYVAVVTLHPTSSSSEVPEPKMTYRFPPATNKDKFGDAIISFCYPDIYTRASMKPDKKSKSDGHCETFSFVLTDTSAGKRFGYCRRLFVEGKFWECYCLLSTFPSFSLFATVLDIVEERRKTSSASVFTFLKAVLNNDLPAPGQSINVRTFSTSGDGMVTYKLSRPANNDYLLDYISFGNLFKCVKLNHLLTLFSAIMEERRIILVSSKLSILSTCVDALSALINPFSWQHVFIPVLPENLVDYCCAPMPFLMGALSGTAKHILTMDIESVYMFDLDKNKFIRKPKDPSIFPASIESRLRKSIDSALRTGPAIGSRKFDLLIARKFIFFLGSLFSGYSSFLRLGQEPPFDLEGFVATKPKEEGEFLRRFSQVQLWDCFLLEREQMYKPTDRRASKIETCPFVKLASEEKVRHHEENEEFFCSKCKERVEGDFATVKGRPICEQCKVQRKKGLFSRAFNKSSEDVNSSSSAVASPARSSPARSRLGLGVVRQNSGLSRLLGSKSSSSDPNIEISDPSSFEHRFHMDKTTPAEQIREVLGKRGAPPRPPIATSDKPPPAVPTAATGGCGSGFGPSSCRGAGAGLGRGGGSGISSRPAKPATPPPVPSSSRSRAPPGRTAPPPPTRPSDASYAASNVRVGDVAARYEVRGGRGGVLPRGAASRVQTKRYPSSPTLTTTTTTTTITTTGSSAGRGGAAPFGRGGAGAVSASALAPPGRGNVIRRTTVGSTTGGGHSAAHKIAPHNRAPSPDPPRGGVSPGSFRFCASCGTPAVGAAKFVVVVAPQWDDDPSDDGPSDDDHHPPPQAAVH